MLARIFENLFGKWENNRPVIGEANATEKDIDSSDLEKAEIILLLNKL